MKSRALSEHGLSAGLTLQPAVYGGDGVTSRVLQEHFHLPEKMVARMFDMCLTSFKKICRSHSIKRWPYRKFKSLSSKLAKVEAASATSAATGKDLSRAEKKKKSILLGLESLGYSQSDVSGHPIPSGSVHDTNSMTGSSASRSTVGFDSEQEKLEQDSGGSGGDAGSPNIMQYEDMSNQMYRGGMSAGARSLQNPRMEQQPHSHQQQMMWNNQHDGGPYDMRFEAPSPHVMMAHLGPGTSIAHANAHLAHGHRHPADSGEEMFGPAVGFGYGAHPHHPQYVARPSTAHSRYHTSTTTTTTTTTIMEQDGHPNAHNGDFHAHGHTSHAHSAHPAHNHARYNRGHNGHSHPGSSTQNGTGQSAHGHNVHNGGVELGYMHRGNGYGAARSVSVPSGFSAEGSEGDGYSQPPSGPFFGNTPNYSQSSSSLLGVEPEEPIQQPSQPSGSQYGYNFNHLGVPPSTDFSLKINGCSGSGGGSDGGNDDGSDASDGGPSSLHGFEPENSLATERNFHHFIDSFEKNG